MAIQARKAKSKGSLTLKQKAEFWRRCRKDFVFFARHVLRVRDIIGGIPTWVPFVLRHEQLELLQTLLEQDRQGVPMRAIICKARKLGMTTLMIAFAFWKCCFVPAYRALVISHRAESTQELGLIAMGFNEQLPSFVRRRLAAKPRNHGLQWANGSYIKVQTGRSDHATRGASPSLVLLSEAASYEYNRAKTTGEDSISATMGSMDYVAGTCCVLESSALGPSGAFWSRYQQAAQDDRLGTAMFRPLFFGWQRSQKYNSPTPGFVQSAEDIRLDRILKTTTDAAERHATAQALGYDATWTSRALQHDLTPPQVRWALRQISGGFGNDLRRFDREFPVSADVAFMSAEGSVFPSGDVDRWTRLHAPVLQGIAIQDGELVPGGGQWWIWRLPSSPSEEFVIGVDVSAGGGADASTIEVVSRHTGEQVAEFHDRKTPPDVLGVQVAEAARLYNGAFAVIERNADGGTTIRACLDHGYAHLYRRNAGADVKPGSNWIQNFGFVTSSGSRPGLVAGLVGHIREEWLTISSKRFGIEASSFVYDKKGKADHKPGCHSDCIIGLALAVFGHGELSAPKPLPSVTQPSIISDKIQAARAAARKRTGRKKIDPHLGSLR